MIVGLHHVQISVPTAMEAEGRRFYGEVLELPEITKPDGLQHRGGIWFQLGDRQLHLAVEDGVNRRVTKVHVAYEVTDLEFWKKRLAEYDCTPLESIPIPGYERFETRDPFGNRIEFIQRVA